MKETAIDRKNTPVTTGVLMYFPDALKEVAKASKAGNDQHHPDKPLHWDKSKSTDEYDAMNRHLIDSFEDEFDDDAEDSECKESLLAYYFLLAQGEPMTVAEVDQGIENWLAQRWQCRVNFDIEDALGKLQQLDLARCDGEHWNPVVE